VACVAFDLPYLPFRSFVRMIVRSSASPLAGIPLPVTGCGWCIRTINFCFFFEILQSRKTNATNATHASIPYAIRLSGCGVCSTQTPHMPPKRHTRPQNATLVLRDIVATPLPQCPLAGIRSASASAWRDSPAAASEACSPVEPEPRHFGPIAQAGRSPYKAQGIPPVGSPVDGFAIKGD